MRITNHIRVCIENALIEHAFSARQKELKRREHALALRIYRTRMSEAYERKWDDLDAARVDNGFGNSSFLSRISNIDVYYGAIKNRRLSMGFARVWTSTAVPDIVIEGDDQLGADFEKYVADEAALSAETRKARAEISATLAPIFTAKALRAAWPEVMSVAEPILVECGMAPKAQPLVVATENLNITLGLPAEVAEEQLEAA